MLLGVDALRVRLSLGGRRFDVERLALDRHWRGEYASLWRGPEFLGTPPLAGPVSPAVDWIHDRLRDRAGLALPEAGAPPRRCRRRARRGAGCRARMDSSPTA